jgi:transcriptional regulator PpsR
LTQFETPKQSLSGLSIETNAALLAAAADVVLVIDGDGVIQDVAANAAELPVTGGERSWIGKAWADIVAADSKSKISRLLKEGDIDSKPVWRQINIPALRGTDLPLSFCTVPVGPKGRMIAFGRDMRAQSELQQQLIDAQQAMERDYLRLRHMESRYRILFDLTSEGVLVVDAKNLKIIEANPAAAVAFGESVRRLMGRNLLDCVDGASRTDLTKLLDAVKASGKPDETDAKVSSGRSKLTLSASMMHEEGGELFLLRVASSQQPQTASGSAIQAALVLRVLEQAPDAFVVTDNSGEVLAANRAFIDMAQLSRPEQALGESLDRWLGRAGVDMNVLLANLRQRGSVRLFATTFRNENGAAIPVEISAVSVPQGDQTGLGFTIRDVGRRLGSDTLTRHEMPRSVEQLTELVGRVPLREIVGETTELIEKLCIDAALQLTQDNRATASEILGLSRQSLYVKLRQYGLGNLGGEDR